MNTNSESPQSVTVQFYFKGFSILLTKRDLAVEIKPLLESAMASIDWAIEHNLQPSWNQETNKQVAQTPLPVVPDEFKSLGKCKICGTPNVLSSKNNPFCPNKCWLKQA